MKGRYIFLAAFLILITVIVAVSLSKGGTNSINKTAVKKQPAPLPKELTVTLDKNGFSPKEVTITVGSAVRWKNVSGSKQTVNSDNYPTNQLHKELNFGVFNSGSSVASIFTKPGIYGYHNQFHHEQSGKIIVVQ